MSDADTPALRAFPRWRMMAGIFAGLTALLVAWYFFALREDDVVLYRDMRPADASAIVAELDREHVHYRLSEGGTQILVPQSQADTLRVRLAGADVTPTGAAGLELFDESDMGLTEFAQKIKYQRAIQGEIARTIMMMDGVVAVRVHISTPERSLFRSEQRTAHAAVTLVTRSPEAETPAQIEGIQRLVAAAVNDLSPSDVVVLNAHGEVLSSTIEHLYTNPSVTAAAPISLLGGNGDDQDAVALFVAVIGRALPDRRFDIVISHPAANANADSSPAGRIIDISTEDALLNTETERLRTVLQQAALITDADTLSFHAGLAPLRTTSAHTSLRASDSPEGTQRPALRHSTLPSLASMAAVLLALLIGASAAALLWTRRRKRRGTLTTEDHEAFAERLRAGLKAQEQAREPA